MTGPLTRSLQETGRARSRISVLLVAAPDLSSALSESLKAGADLRVVGEVAGADAAVRMVAALRPDVVILDLDVAGGNVQHAIQQIMGHTPTPILGLSAKDSGREALVAGAVEVMARPHAWTSEDEISLCRRVRILRGVTVVRHPRGRLGGRAASGPGAGPGAAEPGAESGSRRHRVVAIAASTGGPAALAKVMPGLGGIQAPVLVVQHMHTDFVEGLVTWMDRVCPLPARVAVDGGSLEPGVVYIAPGDMHLKVAPGLRMVLDPEPVTAHRPSADELFLSMADQLGPDGIGVVLTGMGSDGAVGLLAMHERGAVTIAQDEETSVVFGMPKAATAVGAASLVLPLDAIAAALVAVARGVRP